MIINIRHTYEIHEKDFVNCLHVISILVQTTGNLNIAILHTLELFLETHEKTMTLFCIKISYASGYFLRL